jgi:prepilin-type N-terminal cleavage/methylation domain-containing protein
MGRQQGIIRTRLKWRQTLKRRAGFTLVEMIVTLLIIGIVIAMSVTFLTSGSNFLNRTEENASDKTVTEKAADFIKERLLYASEVVVVESSTLPTKPDGKEILYIGSADGVSASERGRLFYRRADSNASMDVLGETSYRNNELAMSYSAAVTEDDDAALNDGITKAAIFDVSVMAVRDGRKTETARQAFRMYNVGLDSEPCADTSIASWSGSGTGGKPFYLVITPPQNGYSKSGIVAMFDGINNSRSSAGDPEPAPNQTTKWSDISGRNNDMKLELTNNPTPVNGKTIYFDGNGDYGRIDNLRLSQYDAVTIEVCFREGTDSGGTLFEYSDGVTGGWVGSGVFGASVNSSGTVPKKGEMHSVAWVGGYSNAADSARNFNFPANRSKLKTVTFVMSNEDSPNGRMAFVNGQRGEDGTGRDFINTNGYPTTKATTRNAPFGDWTFSVAARLASPPTLCCKIEIAAIRIYGRALNADEIAKNAAEDKARFGR